MQIVIHLLNVLHTLSFILIIMLSKDIIDISAIELICVLYLIYETVNNIMLQWWSKLPKFMAENRDRRPKGIHNPSWAKLLVPMLILLLQLSQVLAGSRQTIPDCLAWPALSEIMEFCTIILIFKKLYKIVNCCRIQELAAVQLY